MDAINRNRNMFASSASLPRVGKTKVKRRKLTAWAVSLSVSFLKLPEPRDLGE